LEKELAGKKLNFMVNNTFLVLTLQELLEQLSISNESVVDLYYLFALEKPKPKKSIPTDEWISTIRSLSHIVNEKAKSYAVGFFNGDVKVYDSKHNEVLNVTKLHPDSQITDMLYFKSDALDQKYLITCSELPNAQMTISKIGADKKTVKIVARAKASLMEEAECGYSCLAQNPIEREKFCCSSQVIDDPDTGILLWDVNPATWEEGDDAKVGHANKRQKTGIQNISPIAQMRCTNGVQSMTWASQSTLIAGCTDHQLKVFDTEKLLAQASVFTNHKVITALDANFSNQNQLVLGGHEDGIVKLYDLR